MVGGQFLPVAYSSMLILTGMNSACDQQWYSSFFVGGAWTSSDCRSLYCISLSLGAVCGGGRVLTSGVSCSVIGVLCCVCCERCLPFGCAVRLNVLPFEAEYRILIFFSFLSSAVVRRIGLATHFLAVRAAVGRHKPSSSSAEVVSLTPLPYVSLNHLVIGLDSASLAWKTALTILLYYCCTCLFP